MECFNNEYLKPEGTFQLKSISLHSENGDKRKTKINAVLEDNSREVELSSRGNGPIDAFVNGIKKHLGIPVDVSSYSEHSLTRGSNAKAVSYIGITTGNDNVIYGVGIDENVSYASIKAILSAVNRIKKGQTV